METSDHAAQGARHRRGSTFHQAELQPTRNEAAKRATRSAPLAAFPCPEQLPCFPDEPWGGGGLRGSSDSSYQAFMEAGSRWLTFSRNLAPTHPVFKAS